MTKYDDGSVVLAELSEFSSRTPNHRHVRMRFGRFARGLPPRTQLGEMRSGYPPRQKFTVRYH